MASVSKKARILAAVAIPAVAALALTGCNAGGGGDASGDNLILVGTTDKVTTLDPAGSYDNGSLAVQTQVFPYLVNTDYNSTDVVPDLAESAEFTSPSDYTVTLPAGLKWANGNDLTASDVMFSFERNIAIADPNGASSLLYNLDSVEATDDTDRRLPPQDGERPGLPVHPHELPRRHRRRGGLLGRRGDPGQRHRRGERLRRSVHDHVVRLQPDRRVRTEPRVPGSDRAGEQRGCHPQLLRRLVEPQARRAGG